MAWQAEMAIITDLLRLVIRNPLPVDVIFNFNGGEEAQRRRPAEELTKLCQCQKLIIDVLRGN